MGWPCVLHARMKWPNGDESRNCEKEGRKEGRRSLARLPLDSTLPATFRFARFWSLDFSSPDIKWHVKKFFAHFGGALNTPYLK